MTSRRETISKAVAARKHPTEVLGDIWCAQSPTVYISLRGQRRFGAKVKPLSRQQIEKLADDLRMLLVQIEAGELKANATTRHRIQGALTALEVIQGEVNWTDSI